jgi:outer membrane receptor protein involved in Fe transport
MSKIVEVGLAAGLFCCVLISYAQQNTGTISGGVTDSSGAALPAATVVIENEETGISRNAQTDNTGRYSAPSLSLGKYRVTASMAGFQTEVRSGIELTVGRDAIVNLQLAVGAVSQTVEVTGEAPLVEASKASVSYLVDDRTIRDLPLNGRDLTQLILLNPGVSAAENGNHSDAYDGFAVRISIGGMRGEDNAYLLDGTYINDMNRHLASGPSGAILGAESVREFQVLTNSYGAQYGRAQGGVFNAVSKSGTNEWHGSAYEFLRNSDLDARNFFSIQNAPAPSPVPPFRRNQFGSSAGGPIKRDKAFFFGAYEGWRESLTQTQIQDVPNAAARLGVLPGVPNPISVSPLTAPYLAFFPLPSPQGRDFGDGTAQYIFPAFQPTTEDFGQGRVDYQSSSKDSLFGRITVDHAQRSAVTNFPVFRQIGSMANFLTTVSEMHIFSPAALATTRFSFNRVNPIDQGVYPSISPSLLSIPGQLPPGIIVTGVSSWEGYPKPVDKWTTNRFNFQDDVNLTEGSHSLQFGGMIERMQFNDNQPDRPFGEWTFATLQSFLSGVPSQFRGTPPELGSSNRGFRQDFFALYVQDDWRVKPRLTLNLGVRWEPYTVPTEVNNLIANLRHITDTTELGAPYWQNHSMKDFGPRFGFAWSPFAAGKTSVRGGIGEFYVPNDPNVYRSAAGRSTFFPNIQFPNPKGFPDGLAAIAAAPAANQAVEAVPYYNLNSAHAIQYTMNVQQQLPGQAVLTVGFVGSHGIDQNCYCEYNLAPATYDGVSLAVAANGVRTNPNFLQIYYYANAASSWYDGLTVSVQRRFFKNLQITGSYTYSKSLSEADSSSKTDQSGSGGGLPKYARDLSSDKGFSGYDLPQVFTINYVYDIPLAQGWKGVTGKVLSGWQWSGIFSAQSGQPFTVTASASSALTALSYGTRTPNLNLGFTRSGIIEGGPIQYFNPSAFAVPGSLELGNAAKNFLFGPGLEKFDTALVKNLGLTERLKLQFRAEVFNILNRANFANPTSNVFSASGARQGSAGAIASTVTTSRQIQFALKLTF